MGREQQQQHGSEWEQCHQRGRLTTTGSWALNNGGEWSYSTQRQNISFLPPSLPPSSIIPKVPRTKYNGLLWAQAYLSFRENTQQQMQRESWQWRQYSDDMDLSRSQSSLCGWDLGLKWLKKIQLNAIYATENVESWWIMSRSPSWKIGTISQFSFL